MSVLTVVEYDDSSKAGDVRARLLDPEKDYLGEIMDAALAMKNSEGKVSIEHLIPLNVAEGLGDTFLGNLLGFIFHRPEPGDAVQKLPEDIGGALNDVGFSEESMREYAEKLPADHPVLFVLTRSAAGGKTAEMLRGSGGKMMQPPHTI